MEEFDEIAFEEFEIEEFEMDNFETFEEMPVLEEVFLEEDFTETPIMEEIFEEEFEEEFADFLEETGMEEEFMEFLEVKIPCSLSRSGSTLAFWTPLEPFCCTPGSPWTSSGLQVSSKCTPGAPSGLQVDFWTDYIFN